MSRRRSTEPQRPRRRRVNSRKLTVQPQFTLDDVYITVFTERRVINADGSEDYQPIEHRRRTTHIEMFDAYRVALDESRGNLRDFCNHYGLSIPYLNGFIFALTGMDAMTFRLSWQMRRADELLRYTDLAIPEVARQSGVGSSPNLFYACSRDYGCSPSDRRAAIREAYDVGRYR